MSAKGLAVSAAELVGAGIVERGASKAIQSLPKQKQNKIRKLLMVAGAIMLLVSAFKKVKQERNANYVNNA